MAIDEASLERVGRWPWPRTRTAEIIAKLADGGARVVTLDILMNEPDQNSRLGLAQTLAERYRTLGLDRGAGPGREFARTIEEALTTADTDAALTEVLAATRRVVMPYFFVFPPFAAPPLDDTGRRLLNRSRIVAFASPEAEHALSPSEASGVTLPLPRFQAAVAGAGHANVLPDGDGALRRMQLVVRWEGGYYPSMTLETARLALGVPRTRVQIAADRRILLPPRAISTDGEGRLLLSYYGPAGTIPTRSASDVLENVSPPPVAGDVVIVGFTAHGLMDIRPTPFSPIMPGVEIQATALANLMEGRGLHGLGSLLLSVEMLVVLLLAVAAPLAPPRLGAQWATVVVVVAVGGILGVAHAAFRAGTWVPVLPPLVALVLGHAGSVTYQVLVEQREQRWIRRAFMQYVPPSLVQQLGRDPAALTFGGQRKTLTVLFSDIRGFTSFSERHTPEEVVATLQEYLTALVEVVFRHRGTLDKFIGDAIMAFFGAPFDNPDHALQACRAAVEMSEVVERLNEKWRAAGREPLGTGFGITTGEMLIGNFGSAQRFTYTVIGDQVNLAARLESLNKEYPTRRHVIISEGTYAQVREHVTARSLGHVTVKGKLQAVEIFDLVEVKAPAREGAS